MQQAGWQSLKGVHCSTQGLQRAGMQRQHHHLRGSLVQHGQDLPAGAPVPLQARLLLGPVLGVLLIPACMSA